MPIVNVFDTNDMTSNFSYEKGTNEWAISPDLPNWASYFNITVILICVPMSF